MILVVDASVLVKWFVTEEDSEHAEQLIDRRFELHAPDLLLPEFGNILWKKCRNDDIVEDIAVAAIDAVHRREIVIHSSQELLKAAFWGASETGQSVYDWTYLALAISLDCKFVTADRKFFLGMRTTRFKNRFVWVGNIPSLV
ncbi:MAG: type II toxin-antitoxin system VapC family toxin [Pyrinomonadaceae bacterium]